jgi:hypothetical protein
MIVLFRNIPHDAYHNDFINIIEPALNGGFFKPNGNISNIEIIAQKEKDTDPLEFQALVTIEPEIVAQRVIKKLHGHYLRGCRLMVRQYYLRSTNNDKRNNNPNSNSSFTEKRSNTTRRRTLKVYRIAVPEYR